MGEIEDVNAAVKRLSRLLIAACVVALLGCAARGAYSRYLSDDFTTANRLSESGFRLWFALLLIAGTLGAVYLATGTAVRLPAPGRALIVPYFYLIAGIALVGSAVGAAFSAARRRLASAVLAVLLVTGPGVALVRNALELPADRAFARSWDAVDKTARAHPGGDLEVAAPERVHGLRYIYRDRDGNTEVSEYYRLRSIVSR